MAPDAGRAVLHHVRLPMSTPFDHPAARRRTSDSLLLALEDEGVTALGECAPRPYVTGETIDGVRAELDAVDLPGLVKRLGDRPPEEWLARLLRRGFTECFGIDGGNNLLCLLESAVLDRLGKQLGLSGQQLLSGGAASRAPEDPLPISQVLDLSLDVEEFLATRGPFHFVKIKASDDAARDVRTVTAIRDALGDGVPIMIDANMSWHGSHAVALARGLRDAGADYVEEPMAPRSWGRLRDLRRDGALRVMLDESVCTRADLREAIAADACDAVNIRVAKNGGPLAAARLAGLAREHGIRFQIGVQVAEIGPLINAGRALGFIHRDALTVEAGQSDRFFPEMVVSPAPGVDRRTNTCRPAEGPGWGMELSATADRWALAAR